VMPASIEMSNYYFHQISSFCCFNVLMYYAVLITGGTYRLLVTPIWQDCHGVCSASWPIDLKYIQTIYRESSVSYDIACREYFRKHVRVNVRLCVKVD